MGCTTLQTTNTTKLQLLRLIVLIMGCDASKILPQCLATDRNTFYMLPNWKPSKIALYLMCVYYFITNFYHPITWVWILTLGTYTPTGLRAAAILIFFRMVECIFKMIFFIKVTVSTIVTMLLYKKETEDFLSSLQLVAADGIEAHPEYETLPGYEFVVTIEKWFPKTWDLLVKYSEYLPTDISSYGIYYWLTVGCGAALCAIITLQLIPMMVMITLYNCEANNIEHPYAALADTHHMDTHLSEEHHIEEGSKAIEPIEEKSNSLPAEPVIEK